MKPIWVIAVSVLATAALVGGGTYYLTTAQAEKEQEKLQLQIDELSEKLTPTTGKNDAQDGESNEEVASDPTANWKTITDSSFSISFKYPDSWPTTTSKYLSAEDNDFAGVAGANANFTTSDIKDKGKIRLVKMTKLADYTTTGDKSQVTQLKSVYSAKNTSAATTIIMLPHVNAAIAGSTKPTYIETADGVFRGVYYFASIGQDYSTMLDCVIVLTDNTNVVTLHFALPSDKAANYKKSDGTIDPSFLDYVKALTTESDEALIKEFNSVYKYIAQSLTKTSTSQTTKSYSSSELGFSLEYPKAWSAGKFDSSADSVTFNDEDDHWQVSVIAKSTSKSLADEAKAKIMTLGGGAAGGSGVTNTDTTIGGVTAKKITAPVEGGKTICYLVVNGGKLYTINLFTETATNKEVVDSIKFN